MQRIKYSSTLYFDKMLIMLDINEFVRNKVFLIALLGCKMYGFVSSTAALAEIWSLSAISYDRLNTIMYPLNRAKRLKKYQV